MDTIRVNNVDIDKEEAYEYLYEILIKAYKKMTEKDDEASEEYYLDTCDFIRTIIGEENVDDFIEYTSGTIFVHDYLLREDNNK